MDIRAITTVQFFDDPAAPGLLAEYARESSISGLPQAVPHRPTYEMLEQSGAMVLFGAYEGDELIGGMIVLVHINPHYSAPLAVSESLFVREAYRKTGAGAGLMAAAEAHAKAKGAIGLLITAPTDSVLARVLGAKTSWRETNRVFCKALT